ncbi:diacylglycerol/lipid kinase family protein [Arenibaculum pallidiluteum]|uniref:diacylglycerol/lipid kinase family protein n=1 Tax=Arenibaculum pallidiluteum TaxID=2812559 RepID=UPI001A969A3C|nr:diacylglycerol kinase family protein [Arenibaculum pallidiluteum]
MKIAVVLNAAAGSLLGETVPDVATRIEQILHEAGHEPQVETASGAGIVPLIERAAASDADAVIVGGGDGTVACAANRLIGTGKALGILPLGTLNLYAGDLGVPSGIDEAVRALAFGTVRPLDVGEVNGRLFLNHSVLGLYPRIVEDREETREHLGVRKWRLSKWPAMALAVLRALRDYPMLNVTLMADGRRRHFLTPALAVANNAYDDGYRAFLKRSRLDSGKLALYVAKHRSPWRMLKLILSIGLGRWQQDDELEVLELREFTVTTLRGRLRVANDGEVERLSAPLRYRIRPGALDVLVPAAPEGRAPAGLRASREGTAA